MSATHCTCTLRRVNGRCPGGCDEARAAKALAKAQRAKREKEAREEQGRFSVPGRNIKAAGR